MLRPRPSVLRALASLSLALAVPASFAPCALGQPAGFAPDRLPLDPPLSARGVTYSPAIPTPDAVLGTRVGTRHLRPDEIAAFTRAMDAASDRIVVEEYARTYEGRPLVQAIISSPENLARIDAIRAVNLRLSDAPGSVSDADLEGMPAVVWMGYSVHGNEASGADAAVLTLYHLAAGQGAGIDSLLRNTVILLDPLYNPDGRSRFVEWATRSRGAIPMGDLQDLEHNEPWPGGRTNHYWFDLNRDWLPALHPESAGRLARFHQWRPQLLLDFHEMGGESTFFFQPGIPSRTNPNTPAINQVLTTRIAAYHARLLDRIGSLYYTRESFDDFYYGKGSTYPDVNGGIGILFEQASSRALVADTRNNGRLTFGFTVRNQASASLSSLDAALAMRTDLLKMQRDFYRSASDVPREAGFDGYVFGDGGDPQRAAMLVELLGRHRIRVHRLARRAEAEGQRFEPGAAYVVPLDQPQARLIRGVFERPLAFTDSLFYDVSAWTLPYAYGLPMAEVRSLGGLAGDVVSGDPMPAGRVVGGRAAYAYALPWTGFFTPRAVYKLMEAGVRVRVLPLPFEASAGGSRTAFGRGTVVVAVTNDVPADTVHALVARIAEQDGVTAYALSTGLALGGADLGSTALAAIERPRIALVVGEGTNSNNAGEVWHLLSERMRLPVALLDARRLATLDLSGYTTLLMTGGTYPVPAAEPLKAWVQRGGRLVATSTAVAWATANGLAALDARATASRDSLLRALPYDQLENARGAQAVGGAIFETRVDTSHPLAFGLPEKLWFFRDEDAFYAPSRTPGANVATYTNAPLAAGYLSKARQGQARGAAAVVALRSGRGRVVLMPDNPAFRGFWLGSSSMLMNAIFLSELY